jgi:hypothetical protein
MVVEKKPTPTSERKARLKLDILNGFIDHTKTRYVCEYFIDFGAPMTSISCEILEGSRGSKNPLHLTRNREWLQCTWKITQ